MPGDIQKYPPADDLACARHRVDRIPRRAEAGDGTGGEAVVQLLFVVHVRQGVPLRGGLGGHDDEVVVEAHGASSPECRDLSLGAASPGTEALMDVRVGPVEAHQVYRIAPHSV